MQLSQIRFKTDFTPFADDAEGSVRLLERATGTPRTGRTYKNVTLVKVGLGNKRDKNFYPKETLKEAADAGTFEGLRAFADHPTSIDDEILPERSIRDQVGIYTNTKFVESGGGRIVGSLRIFKNASWLSSMIDELIEMKQADKIGISINGSGKTSPRRVRLSESGELEEVNYLESFMNLRSADVVTEAGAGGGFQRLLESARGATRKRNMNLTKEQKARLQEANTPEEIERLLTEFREAGEGGQKPKQTKDKASEKRRRQIKEKARAKRDGAAEEADEIEEADIDEMTDEELDELEDELDAVNHETELEETASRIKGDTDAEGNDVPLEDDEDDLEESDDPEDEDGLEDDEDEDDQDDDLEESEDGSDVDDPEEAIEAMRNRGLRRATKDSDRRSRLKKRVREAAGGNLSKSVRGKKRGSGNLMSSVRGKTGTSKGVERPAKGGARGGAARRLKFSEAGNIGLTREARQAFSRLQRQVDVQNAKISKLAERNERLSGQLHLRQSTDRARKLLRESEIPEELRATILPQMVGKSEEAMRNIIGYHERLVGTVLKESAQIFEDADDVDSVEGAGAQIRESFGGESGDPSDFLAEMGLPLKAPKK